MMNLEHPSTSTNHLQSAPEDVLVEILRRIPSRSLAIFRQVSPHLKRLIHTHSPQLQRPSIYHIKIQTKYLVGPAPKKLMMQTRRKTGKNFSKYYLTSKEYNVEGNCSTRCPKPMLLDLKEILWSSTPGHSLELQGIRITDELLMEFIRPAASLRHLCKLNFLLCDFCSDDGGSSKDIQPLFQQLLTKSGISGLNLTIEFCQGVEQLLTDQLLQSIPHLNQLDIQLLNSGGGGSLPLLTDRVLSHWAAQPVQRVPRRLDFRRIHTNFTLAGVCQLICALFRINSELRKQGDRDVWVDWQLGTVKSTLTNKEELGQFHKISTTLPTDCESLPPLFQMEKCLEVNRCTGIRVFYEGDRCCGVEKASKSLQALGSGQTLTISNGSKISFFIAV